MSVAECGTSSLWMGPVLGSGTPESPAGTEPEDPLWHFLAKLPGWTSHVLAQLRVLIIIIVGRS